MKTKAAKTIVLAFGNPLVEEDRLALRVCRRLRKLARSLGLRNMVFLECSRPEAVLNQPGGSRIFVLDAAKGLRKPREVSVSALEDKRFLLAHSLDLGAFLKLARRAGLLKSSVKIIGLPPDAEDKDKLAAETLRLIARSSRS
jgi:Ni,Fe-hydrogenase maturation factor